MYMYVQVYMGTYIHVFLETRGQPGEHSIGTIESLMSLELTL